eukprot:4785704-Pleurochrysis_carterae.AAC.1
MLRNSGYDSQSHSKCTLCNGIMDLLASAHRTRAQDGVFRRETDRFASASRCWSGKLWRQSLRP